MQSRQISHLTRRQILNGVRSFYYTTSEEAAGTWGNPEKRSAERKRLPAFMYLWASGGREGKKKEKEKRISEDQKVIRSPKNIFFIFLFFFFKTFH